ncbi:hypothetical protein EGW08_016941, partial [Elysia chlorotica]
TVTHTFGTQTCWVRVPRSLIVDSIEAYYQNYTDNEDVDNNINIMVYVSTRVRFQPNALNLPFVYIYAAIKDSYDRIALQPENTPITIEYADPREDHYSDRRLDMDVHLVDGRVVDSTCV